MKVNYHFHSFRLRIQFILSNEIRIRSNWIGARVGIEFDILFQFPTWVKDKYLQSSQLGPKSYHSTGKKNETKERETEREKPDDAMTNR